MKVKKLLCLALCLAMVFTLLPVGVLAKVDRTYNVGQTVINTSANASGDGWSWDYSGKKLTLNNACIVGSGNNDGAISLPFDSTIELKGENSVTGGNPTAPCCCGIFCTGDLTITGTGNLTVIAEAATNSSVGIISYNKAAFLGGSTVVMGGAAEIYNSYGISCTSFEISGANTKVVAVGGKKGSNTAPETESCGIHAHDTITYTSGLLVAKGSTAATAPTNNVLPDSPLYGSKGDKCIVYGDAFTYTVCNVGVTVGNSIGTLNNTIIIGADSNNTANALSFSNDGTLECTGFNVVLAGNAPAGDSNAVFSGSNNLTVSGSGRLVAIGGEAGGGNSSGIAGKSTTLNGSVTAIGGYGAYNSYGISADTDGGAITLGGDGTAVGGTQAMNLSPSVTTVACTGAYDSTAMAWATPTVKINGLALTSATPYYFNSGNSSRNPTNNENDWNAWFDIANSTLHLRNLSVATREPQAIKAEGISTLYIELEGTNIVTDLDLDVFGIYAPSANLVIYGSGSLTVTAEDGVGISAQSIKLQYPATLTVKGRGKATDKMLTCIADAYDAKGGTDLNVTPTANYNFTGTDTATAYKHITFTPKAAPAFPVWVDGIQIDSTYIGNGANVCGGTVTYAPAHGSTPATLTLNGAHITSYKAFGSIFAGIYAEDEPLCILLKGTNSIDISAPSGCTKACGVYSTEALTITADAGASLKAGTAIQEGSSSGTPYAIHSDGGITLDSSCEITDPNGAKISTTGKFISGSNGTTVLDEATITGNVITIQRSDGVTFDVHVSLTDSIENIKAKIQQHWGYSPDRQQLSYNGAPLAEGKTLADCGISYGATLNLTVTTNAPVITFPTTCTLTFKTNGGSAVAAVGKAKGETVDLTNCVPTREGYTFTGWYSDAALTKPVTSVTLSGSTTVYAGWQKDEPQNVPWKNPFSDVNKTDWFYSDVEHAVSHGLFKGITDTAFEPGAPMSRAMLVTALYRLAGEPTIMFVRAPDKVFSDVPDGIWYEQAVQWAQLSGIVEGYDGKFDPDGDVTREQLAAILYRCAQHMGYDVSVGEDTNILSYTDAFDISEYAIPAMQWVCGAGIMEGSGESLMPQGNAQRCQVAAMLHRFCENVK